MIARVWRASALAQNVAAYAQHLRENVFTALQSLEGYCGAQLLTRDDGDRTQIIVMTLWESREAITRFAGDDIERAVIAPEAIALLAEYERTVQHYDVAEEDRWPPMSL
ncbi:MAG TPA: antibiotic biosynthesis monooxygenase [Thermoanaerobaculia bacterium]|nr:antibiotic biosynthesis monooxygenase [Thermoanaerobaculia bacterium]